MSLRARLTIYVALVHLLAAGAVAWFARHTPVWLIAVELVCVISFAVGMVLVGRVLRSVNLGDDAARLIREGDVTTRLRPVGDGQTDGLIEVYNAMVDTLRAERARIQEQHYFLEQIVTASPTGMIVLDFDSRISRLNPAAERLMGIRSGDEVGKRVSDVASPVAAVLHGLEADKSEVVGTTGGRRLRCYRGTFMDRGFPRTFYVVEELTEEARRIERSAYEKLIRVMSHEVNNSVTASNSLLQSSLAYAKELPPASRADVEDALGIVINRTDQLNRFMRRFADVFRLPAPMKTPERLEDLVAPVARLLGRGGGDLTDVSWTWDFPHEPVYVQVDRGQFEQACLNILKNAIEAAGSGGMVGVRVRVEGEVGTLVVEDSGTGPSAEAQAHLFTPFFSTKTNGQGIGLTVIQEVLTSHGFEYSLERGKDGPTRFTVRMPVEG